MSGRGRRRHVVTLTLILPILLLGFRIHGGEQRLRVEVALRLARPQTFGDALERRVAPVVHPRGQSKPADQRGNRLSQFGGKGRIYVPQLLYATIGVGYTI